MAGAFPRPRAATNYRRHWEEELQIKMCNWIRREFPHVVFVSDFAAGLNLTDTQRQKMYAMRSDDGQPDISIDYPSRGYHGLRLELKKEGTVIYNQDGTLRKAPYTRKYKKSGRLFIKRGDHLAEQAALLQKYNDNGYFARFAIGETHFKKLVRWYLEVPEQEELPF